MNNLILVSSPKTLWLTGLSGAGKTTLAAGLKRKFESEGQASIVLDGDVLRHGLCRDLGFSHADRTENIRRVAEVARLFNSAGVHSIVSFISPFARDRECARVTVGDSSFIEIHVATPLQECEKRDPKGLYLKARNNEIAEFTGISSPYEPPVNPEIVLDTTHLSVDVAVDELFARIIVLGDF